MTEKLNPEAPVELREGGEDAGPNGGPWWKRNLKWIIVGASSLILIAVVAITLVLLIYEGEKTIYSWSSSGSITESLSVDRNVYLKKNAGDSPYLITVSFKLTNLGNEEIGVLEVEEDIPDIISLKGGLSFAIEPEKVQDDLSVAGWSTKNLGPGGTFEAGYDLPLQGELSESQLMEIEEQFNWAILAYVRLPENKINCISCNGAGNQSCEACSASGIMTCTTCGGSGSTTCSLCRGSGTIQTETTCDECYGSGRCYT